MNKRLITVKETAHFLGLAPQTVYNGVNSGTFPVPHVRIGRAVRFDIRELEKYCDKLPRYGKPRSNAGRW